MVRFNISQQKHEQRYTRPKRFNSLTTNDHTVTNDGLYRAGRVFRIQNSKLGKGYSKSRKNNTLYSRNNQGRIQETRVR